MIYSSSCEASVVKHIIMFVNMKLTSIFALSNHCYGVSQDAPIMASPADLWARIQDCEKLQARTEAEKETLKDMISDLNSRVNELSTSLKDRERCILDLNRKLVRMKNKDISQLSFVMHCIS